MSTHRRSNKLFTRLASFTPSSYDAAKRTIGVVWSTGAPVARQDFEGPFTERLDMSADAVDLSQLRGAPVLNSHDRFDVRSILGVVENPSVGDGRGTATVRFSDRPEIAGIVRDIAEGIISRVSVGYSVGRWATTKDAQGVRTKTATRWTPAEISFTAIPADQGARTRASGADDADECTCPPGTDPEDCDCFDDDEEDNMTKAAIPDQIRSAATLLGIADQTFVDNLATREGVTVEAARGELLTHLQQTQPTVVSRTTATVTRDEADTFHDRALNALAHRVEPRIKLRDDARPWAGRRIADIGREFLRIGGVSTLGNDAEIISRWGALHTTSDFGNFLAELFNKQLLPAYLIAPSGLKLLARQATANDFRAKHVYRNSPMGQLMPVNEHGEFKRTTKADVKPESYSVQSFAAVFGISRQALVNDDMGAFSDIGAALAIQAAEFENQQLAALLISNPIMSDGNPFFSAPHANIETTHLNEPDEDSLSSGRLAMRMQTNQNGQPIDVRPLYLLAPAALETDAAKALAAIYPPSTDAVNPFTGFVGPVIDPRLDHAGQVAAWYLFGDVAVYPTLEYSYLSGAEGPRVFTRVGFAGGSDIDGTEILCQLDYGCGVIGWQGAFKNPGA